MLIISLLSFVCSILNFHLNLGTVDYTIELAFYQSSMLETCLLLFYKEQAMKNIFLCLCFLMIDFSIPLQAGAQTTYLSRILVDSGSIENDKALKCIELSLIEKNSYQQEIIDGHKKPCNKCVGICMTACVGLVLAGVVVVAVWHFYPNLIEAS